MRICNATSRKTRRDVYTKLKILRYLCQNSLIPKEDYDYYSRLLVSSYANTYINTQLNQCQTWFNKKLSDINNKLLIRV
jgi:hypothetical protein